MPTWIAGPASSRRTVAIVTVAALTLLTVAAIAIAQRNPRGVVIAAPGGTDTGDGVTAVSPSANPTVPGQSGTPTPTDDENSPEPPPTGDGTAEDGSDVETAEEPTPGASGSATEPSADAPPPQEGTAETDAGGELWGRRFGSVSVTEDGARRALVPGTQLSVSFTRNNDAPSMGWSGGCNAHGASAGVSATHLRPSVEDRHSTAVGCDQPRHEQDAFFTRFLDSGPAWELAGDRLILRSGDTVIAFEEAAPPPTGARTVPPPG